MPFFKHLTTRTPKRILRRFIEEGGELRIGGRFEYLTVTSLLTVLLSHCRSLGWHPHIPQKGFAQQCRMGSAMSIQGISRCTHRQTVPAWYCQCLHRWRKGPCFQSGGTSYITQCGWTPVSIHLLPGVAMLKLSNRSLIILDLHIDLAGTDVYIHNLIPKRLPIL